MADSAPDTTKKPFAGEIATAEKDTDIFAGWLTRMENPDKVLRYESNGQGVRLYEELERDWQVYSMLQTRSLALQACEWQVESASEKRKDVKISEFVAQVLKGANFDRLCRDMMQAVLTGYKPVEVMWEVSEGDVWIAEFRGRRPSRFVFDMQGRPRLLTLQNNYDGEEIPDRKFVVLTFGAHDWNPYGRGLGYQLYWPVWFKGNDIKFWLVFCEKFGSPTLLGKYPPGTDEKDIQILMDAMRAVLQETGIGIPNTMDIGLLEAARSGTINSYHQLASYLDAAIAKVILGQTLTSEPGESGSYSLGKVHNEVREDILKADADDQCECINRTVVRWLVDYNFPVQGRAAYPRVWRRTEPEQDLKALAERDKIILVDMGMDKRTPETYISDTYGIPLAKEGEQTLRAPEPEAEPEPPAQKPGPEGKTDFSETDKGIVGQEKLDRLTDRALSAASEELDAMLRPVLSFIEGAQSFEKIGEKLFQFYPRLDSARFSELLARAMFVAQLTGYEAAREEENA